MPLTRDRITAASRLMLPAYVVMFTCLGVNYLATPPERLTLSPGLAYAASVMPLAGWGIMFLCAAAIMVAALLTQRRVAFQYALLLAGLCMLIWAGLLLAAVIADGQTSPTAPLWPAFIATACLASHRSLNAGEV